MFKCTLAHNCYGYYCPFAQIRSWQTHVVHLRSVHNDKSRRSALRTCEQHHTAGELAHILRVANAVPAARNSGAKRPVCADLNRTEVNWT